MFLFDKFGHIVRPVGQCADVHSVLMSGDDQLGALRDVYPSFPAAVPFLNGAQIVGVNHFIQHHQVIVAGKIFFSDFVKLLLNFSL